MGREPISSAAGGLPPLVTQINRHFDLLIRVCRADILPSWHGCPRTAFQFNPILPLGHVPSVKVYSESTDEALPPAGATWQGMVSPASSSGRLSAENRSDVLLFPKIILLLRE
jgi:hypothetical protein